MPRGGVPTGSFCFLQTYCSVTAAVLGGSVSDLLRANPEAAITFTTVILMETKTFFFQF